MRRIVLVVATATSLVGCVDLTEPWRKSAAASRAEDDGGRDPGPDSVTVTSWPDGGDEADSVGGASGPVDLGGSGPYDAEPSTSIDSMQGEAGGRLDGPVEDAGMAVLDSALADGEGAASASGGDARTDASIDRGSGGAGGSGGSKSSSNRSGGAPGSGGKPGAGGVARTGGASGKGGATGKGGAIGTGGTSGTGGAATPDATPDAAPDVAPDAGVEGPVLPTGLVAYYPCEAADEDGVALSDESGEEHHGKLASTRTPDGGPGAGSSFGAGRVGKALVLSAAGGGYVSLPVSVFAGATDMTIAAWFKLTTATDWQKILDVGVNAGLPVPKNTGMKYLYLAPQTQTADGLAFGIAIDGVDREQRLSSTSSPGPSDGWTHVAVTLGAGSVTLYVDGAEVADDASVALRPDDLGELDYAWLGRSQFTNDPTFDGAIDEVRVYRRALSAAEVKAVYLYQGP